jgi:mannose-6-phosphate isomerase-like protein (cupin superfamily)
MFNGRLVKRKWGWYWTILDRRQFKLKLLRFMRGGELSLQKHNQRGEAWLFLSGLGNIGQCEDGFFAGMIRAGGYWHIKKGSWHKYQAIKPTWVLEVQYCDVGDGCIEEDIVRA